MAAGGVEILGLGQQFVAFGIHPATGQPYHWPLGETPLDVPFEALPLVDAGCCAGLLGEVASLLPPTARELRDPRGATTARPADATRRTPEPAAAPRRAAAGRQWPRRRRPRRLALDHRLSRGARRRPGRPDGPRDRRGRVWERFAATTDLTRPAARGTPLRTRRRRAEGRGQAQAARRRPAAAARRSGRGGRLPVAAPRGSRSPRGARGAAPDGLRQHRGMACGTGVGAAADRHQGHGRPRQERRRPPPFARAPPAPARCRRAVADPGAHAVARPGRGGGGRLARRGRHRRGAARLRGDRSADRHADVPRRPDREGGDRRAARGAQDRLRRRRPALRASSTAA